MNNFHVIKDPVHGVMQFTSEENRWIKPFIDHPYFQRLRHIKQSGLCDLIFPGAVHTRLNHCMGCCYVGGQIANKIGLSAADRQLVMIACLLHDIGHGPFSHTFEDLFEGKSVKHEYWTPMFLQEFNNPEFFTQYQVLNPDLPFDEEKLIEVQQMIMRQHPNKLLSDIVSSQLDADRFDYLLRDSHFCGVKYGEFDLRWMLHCLKPVETKHGLRMGITYKGVGVVEHYLMARRLMMKNIYHHSKKHAIENYMVTLLSQIAENMEHEPLLKFLLNTPLGELLININEFNARYIKTQDKQALVQQFLQQNYMHYKKLTDLHVLTLMDQLASLETDHVIVELARRVHHRIIPEVFPVNRQNIEIAKKLIQEYKARNPELSDWKLGVLNTPQLAYTGDDDAIFVLEKSGQVAPLNEKSLMIRSLSDQYEHACAIYADQEIFSTPGFKALIDEVNASQLEQTVSE